MLIYCLNTKKKKKKKKKENTECKFKSLKIKNGRTILSPKCAVCGSKKSRFLKVIFHY